MGLKGRRAARACLALALALPLAMAASSAHAQSPAEFYRGKTVNFIVGAAPGGAYDTVSRVLVRHLPRHIPGNPQMVMQHMAGAASLVMTNHLYNRAARDGTVVGMPNNSIPLEPRIKVMARAGGAVNFDLDRFNWIGTPTQDPQAMIVWHTAPATSIEAMRSAKVLFGSTGPGADNFVLPTLSKALLGTQSETVTGYPGQAQIFLAMEAGEVHANTTSYLNVPVLKPAWIREKLVRVPVQFGRERLKAIPDVPTAIDLAPTAADKAVFSFYAIKFKIARPIIMPPDVPADRVAAMRQAFTATMKDPEFLDDARKTGLSIDPLGADEIAGLLREISAAPQHLVDRLTKLLGK